MATTVKKARNLEDEYKDTLQPLVDEAMQAHNLAPAMQNAIIENLPLNEELQKAIVRTLERNPDAKHAIDKIVTENRQVKRDKALIAVLSAVGTAVIGGVVALIVAIVTK